VQRASGLESDAPKFYLVPALINSLSDLGKVLPAKEDNYTLHAVFMRNKRDNAFKVLVHSVA
jgi:hypothetical protein